MSKKNILVSLICLLLMTSCDETSSIFLEKESTRSAMLYSGGIEPHFKSFKLRQVYNLTRSTLTQKQIDMLSESFDYFCRGKLGQACFELMVQNGYQISFSVDESINTPGQFNITNNMIKVQYQEYLSVDYIYTIFEELFHASQFNRYGIHGMDNNIANYEFEAKVLVDLNYYEIEGYCQYIGSFNTEVTFENRYDRYINLLMEYGWIVDRGEYLQLEKEWYIQQQKKGSYYGFMSFDSHFVPYVLTENFDYIRF